MSGILAASRITSISPQTNTDLPLQAIAACVIGGVILTGGTGTVLGMMIGATLIFWIQDVLLLVAAPSYYLTAFVGALTDRRRCRIRGVPTEEPMTDSADIAQGRPTSSATPTSGAVSTVEPKVLLELDDVRKTYGQNKALNGVSFKAHRGEILALLGDNGAGKSTLVKTMSGVVSPDSGSKIKWEGTEVQFGSRHDAANLGIETIFQDNALVDSMTVARNIFLGRETEEPVRAHADDRDEADLGQHHLEHHRGEGDRQPRQARREPVRWSQQVSVARAVHFNCTLLILDEPTSALAVRATEALFTYLRTLRDRDITSILVTHDLFDAYRICDRFVVIARGEKVFEARREETTVEELIEKVSHG